MLAKATIGAWDTDDLLAGDLDAMQQDSLNASMEALEEGDVHIAGLDASALADAGVKMVDGDFTLDDLKRTALAEAVPELVDYGLSIAAFQQACLELGIEDFSPENAELIKQLVADPELFESVATKAALIQAAENYAILEGVDLTSFQGIKDSALAVAAPELIEYGLSIPVIEAAAQEAGFADFSVDDEAMVQKLLADGDLLNTVMSQAAVIQVASYAADHTDLQVAGLEVSTLITTGVTLMAGDFSPESIITTELALALPEVVNFGISSDAYHQAAEFAGIPDFSVDDIDMVEQLIADPEMF